MATMFDVTFSWIRYFKPGLEIVRGNEKETLCS